MAVNTAQPSETDIKKWFLDPGEIGETEFQFALVLGGTVSAGAYTAGAVDFLIQALDSLSQAQAAREIPTHTVTLKLIAGTSGGGVNAAIAARALAYRYPHLAARRPMTDQDSGNPFYDTWVRKLTLDGFLNTDDIAGSLVSLFNGQPISDGAKAIVNFSSGVPLARSWVASPLSIILTLTNLRGVPFKTNFGTGLSQGYVDHADHARFELVYPGQNMGEARPDAFTLGFGQLGVPQSIDWKDFSDYAMATAAFPIGFPPRQLSRPTEHYRWRVVPYPPGPGEKPDYKLAWPDWASMGGANIPDKWDFLAVDGGATDNEPIRLARSALSGLLTHSPRKAEFAYRAVWLIDPFAGRAPLGPSAGRPFASEIGSIVTTLTQQTRYDTADLLMAADDNQYSRYMLTPTRDEKMGEDAIASSGLGAFIGFACPDFMHHDFMLGRRNCWQFLKEHFALAPQNKVFKNWKPDEMTDFIVKTSQGDKMPIIPLVGAAAPDPGFADWPVGKLNPHKFHDAIEKRFRAVMQAELSGSLVQTILGYLGAHAFQGRVGKFAVQKMDNYLTNAGLQSGQ